MGSCENELADRYANEAIHHSDEINHFMTSSAIQVKGNVIRLWEQKG